MFNKQALLSIGLIALLSSMSFVVMALEDPTKPPSIVSISNGAGVDSVLVPGWQLSSILISKDRRMAVVNGKTVKRGDAIGGARVVSISATSVKLRNSVETFTVKLLPTQIKSVREE